MNTKIMTPARTNGQRLMRTSDGRIYERMDWDRGHIHQKVLMHYEPEACADYSMDGGEHWAALDGLAPEGNRFTADLKANSITTFLLRFGDGE